MAICLLSNNNIVVQLDLSTSDAPNGWLNCPEDTLPGMEYKDGKFIIPASTPSELKARKIKKLRLACRDEIFSGYDSDALGAVHRYPLSDTDQANLQKTEVSAMKNADTPGWTGMVQCIDGNGVIAYRPHTAAQVDQVAAAIDAGKEASLTKFADLVAQVNDPTTDTEEKLDRIQW